MPSLPVGRGQCRIWVNLPQMAAHTALALELLLLTSCRPTLPAPAAPDAPPQRIVSLAPNLTEILFAIGGGDQVIGVTAYCRHPPPAAARMVVGDAFNINYEQIFALQPDMVLLTTEQVTAALNLHALNLNCQQVDTSSLDAILAAIRRVGELCQRADRADVLVNEMRQAMDQISERIPCDAPPCSVLIVIGRTPGAGGIADVCLAGPGAIYGDMLRRLRVNNAYQGRLPYAQVGQEGLLRMNPDVIIDLAPDLDESAAMSRVHLQSDWDVLASVSAVKNGRVYVLGGDYLCIPGPRVVRIYEDLARAIYPDLFPTESQ